MSVSISVLFQVENDINSLLIASKNYFDTDYSRQTLDDTFVLIDKNDSYVIRISQKRLKFIIEDDNGEGVCKRIETIKDFLSNNFKDKTIGIQCYNDYGNNFNSIRGVNVVKLN